jgi:hypothetical protein
MKTYVSFNSGLLKLSPLTALVHQPRSGELRILNVWIPERSRRTPIARPARNISEIVEWRHIVHELSEKHSWQVNCSHNRLPSLSCDRQTLRGKCYHGQSDACGEYSSRTIHAVPPSFNQHLASESWTREAQLLAEPNSISRPKKIARRRLPEKGIRSS